MEPDTSLGIGCFVTTEKKIGLDSSSDFSKEAIACVELICFDEVTTKLGPILFSAR